MATGVYKRIYTYNPVEILKMKGDSVRVIIPVAGKGTRLKPLTDHTPTPKTLIRVGNRGVIAHILGWVEGMKADEVVFVLPKTGTWQAAHITDYILGYRGDGLPFRFVEQPEPLGSGHAVWLALQDIKGSEKPVLVINGDNITYGTGARSFQWRLSHDCSWELPTVSTLSVQIKDDPRNNGVVEVDRKGYVSSIEEKPKHPKSNRVMSGIFYIRQAHLLFNALDVSIRHNVKLCGEFHLTAALRHMFAFGESFYARYVNTLDCGSHTGLAAAASYFQQNGKDKINEKNSTNRCERVCRTPPRI